MRVLFTADTIGGVWTYAVDLARSLSACGVEIALATLGAPLSEFQRMQVSALDNVTLFESCYKLEWMNHPWEDLQKSGEWLLDIEQNFAPDIVHLNGYMHGSLPFTASKLVVAHSCVLSWWQACRGEAAPREWDRYRDRVRDGLSSADLVVAPTHAMLTQLKRHYGFAGKSKVISNGRETVPGKAHVEKEPLILAAGRLWDEAKNLVTLDAAAASLAYPVYVAGDDSHPDGGQATCTAVRLLGKLDEPTLEKWYSRAAVYALPARYEPFGLSILESALFGCALVLGDIPSLRENWEGAAEFVPPDDVVRLTQKLKSLLETPARLQEVSVRCSQRAMRFSMQACTSSYLDAYRNLLDSESERVMEGAVACKL